MKFEMSMLERTLIIGLVVCGIIIGIGSSFAYYSAKITVENNGASINQTTKVLPKIVYDGGSTKVALLNAKPGQSITKTFTVTIDPTTDTVKYQIMFNNIKNTFENCTVTNRKTFDTCYAANFENCQPNECTLDAKELQYTLTAVDENKTPVSSIGTITGNLTNGVTNIDPITVTQATHADKKSVYTYTLKIDFLDTNAEQNHNQDKNFEMDIDVVLAS